MIRQLFPDIQKNELIFSSAETELSVPEHIYEMFVNSNVRFEMLNDIGYEIELKSLLAKYRTTGDENKILIQDLYYNRSEKMWVDNMFMPNYFVSGISKILNQNLGSLQNNSESEYYKNLKIQTKLLIAQRNSIKLRPNILKPHQYSNKFTCNRDIPLTSNQWVRLGHIEYEIFKENRFDDKIKEFRTYSGIVFVNQKEETIPFSRFRFNPQHLWEPDICPS